VSGEEYGGIKLTGSSVDVGTLLEVEVGAAVELDPGVEVAGKHCEYITF
jgi:hypothetical protein